MGGHETISKGETSRKSEYKEFFVLFLSSLNTKFKREFHQTEKEENYSQGGHTIVDGCRCSTVAKQKRKCETRRNSFLNSVLPSLHMQSYNGSTEITT